MTVHNHLFRTEQEIQNKSEVMRHSAQTRVRSYYTTVSTKQQIKPTFLNSLFCRIKAYCVLLWYVIKFYCLIYPSLG